MSFVEKALAKMRETPAPKGNTPLAAIPIPVTAPVPFSTTVEIEPTRRTIPVGLPELERSGHFPPAAEQRRLSYEFRRVKRPILAAARGSQAVAEGRLIMVASALPGEGKSFSAVNLALSMALEKDFNVLLADADLAKPQISTILGATDEPGLIDALQDHTVDVDSLVLHTRIGNLDFLPAGKYVENATELLGSARMRAICTRLADADKRRIVLFDSPPLLLTNESRVLSEVVGQVVLVVRADSTPRLAVLDALESIAENKHVMAILNQSTPRSGDGHYGYGYGYGEYGADYGKASKS